MNSKLVLAIVLAAPCALAGVAFGQSETPAPLEKSRDTTAGFVEVAGAFGFQFGEQSYLPDGSPGQSKHPFTKGFSANATAGIEVIENLDVIVDYTFSQAESRSGNLPTALADVEGRVSFHTIAAGLRSNRELGPGRLYGELAIGVVLPFETELDYTYAPEMSQLPQPIMGEGSKIDKYNLGVGAHGELGYQWPLFDRVYLAGALRIQGFQSNNDGKSTELDNFVTDFTNPQAASVTIDYDSDGGATPTTYSVQDLRLHLNAGYRF